MEYGDPYGHFFSRKGGARAMRVLGILATLAISLPLGAEEKSGLEKGSPVGAFDVLDVTGPNATKQLCYR